LKSIVLLAVVGLFIWLGVAGIATLAQTTKVQGRNFVPGDLVSMSFVDVDYGWSVAANCTPGAAASSACRSVVFATQDGGRSWLNVGQILLTPRRIVFVDRQVGWMIGSVGRECGTDLCQNVIMLTEDGGKKWARVSTVAAELSDVAAVSANDFWAVGRVCPRNGPCSGALVHTISSGQLWENVALPIVGRDLRTGRASTKAGWVARSDAGEGGPALATTNDGGSTWTTKATPCASGELVDFASADEGWLVCSQPTPGEAVPLRIYQTTDGGTTWRPSGQMVASRPSAAGATYPSNAPLSSSPVAVRAVAPGDVWMTLRSGEVLRALGGSSPSPELMFDDPPRDVRFVDEKHGWLLGSRTVWCTDDGGVTWERYRVQPDQSS
jgi:photosystem II stability/assembly factor-like uncharacterized protein